MSRPSVLKQPGSIGPFLRDKRQEQGLTQQRVATATGLIHQATLWKIEEEAEARPVRFHEAVALSRVLAFDLAEMVALVPEIKACALCGEAPPVGFTCNRCGRSS